MYIDLSDDADGRICLNAAAADKLKEAVDITVDLASSVPASFDGSADVTPGVTGILPIKNGGTNADTNNAAYTNLLDQGATTDANTALKRGIYTWDTSAANVPVEGTTGSIYNFLGSSTLSEHSENSFLWQIGFDTNQTAPYIRKAINSLTFDAWTQLASVAEIDARMGNYLPLTAGEDKKLTGPLGLTADVMYGTTLPTSGFDGQLFFLEDSGATLPTGGSAGNALIKNSADDGDASWQSSQISWVAGTSAGPKPKIFGVEGYAIPVASATASGIMTTDEQTIAGAKTFNSNLTVSGDKIYSKVIGTNGEIGIYVSTNRGLYDFVNSKWIIACDQASTKVYSDYPIYGAVWNDYAEFRSQIEDIEPGYCVASTNNGQVYKTTEKFQACDGIVSDTFGFSIGETDECRTPLAVAGRVLAYCIGNREDYQSGDTVCAGPEGKVMKMTREEIKEYPDRIIGIVSEIPKYDTWGTGNVPINGRIWIKVK